MNDKIDPYLDISIAKSINLFNADNLNLWYYNRQTKNNVTENDVYRSTIVPVIEGETYTTIKCSSYGSNYYISAFDKDMNYIPNAIVDYIFYDMSSREIIDPVEVWNSNMLYQFTIVSGLGIKYININTTTALSSYHMLINGTINDYPSAYIPYKTIINSNIECNNAYIEKYEQLLSTPHIDINERKSINLLNPDDILSDIYLSNNSIYQSSSGYECIKVHLEAGTTYTTVIYPNSYGTACKPKYLDTYTYINGTFYDYNTKEEIEFSIAGISLMYCSFTVNRDADVNFNLRLSTYSLPMIIKGDISQYPNTYVPYYVYYKIEQDVRINRYEELLNQEDNNTENKYLEVEHIKTENLFNPNGEFLNGYFSPNGVFTEYNTIYTQMIPITKPGTYWMVSSAAKFGTNWNVAGAGQFYTEEGIYVKANTITNIEEPKDEQGRWKEKVVCYFTVTEAEVGLLWSYPVGTNIINTTMLICGESYPQEYIQYKNYYYNSNLKIDKDNIIGIEDLDGSKFVANHLYGKTIVFDGDSICQAGGDSYENLPGKLGWAARIGHKNGMNWFNYAVGGGTLVSGLYTQAGTARHWVSTYIDTIYANHPNLDYYIFEGGTNDADLLGWDETGEKYGTFNVGDYTSESWDITKFREAIDMICYKATKYWPHAKIGYIVAQKMGATATTFDHENNKRGFYFKMAMEMCEKWGIPYINLWDCSPLNPKIKTHYDSSLTTEENIAAGKLYYDGQHLTKDGYDFISPAIEAFVKSL